MTPEGGAARDVRRRSIVKGNAFRTIDRANEPLPFPDRVYDLWRTNQLQLNRGCIPPRRRNLWPRDLRRFIRFSSLSVWQLRFVTGLEDKKLEKIMRVSFFFFFPSHLAYLLLDCTCQIINKIVIHLRLFDHVMWLWLKYRNKIRPCLKEGNWWTSNMRVRIIWKRSLLKLALSKLARLCTFRLEEDSSSPTCAHIEIRRQYLVFPMYT